MLLRGLSMETVYNLFAFVDDDDNYTKIGCRSHKVDGDDECKYEYLLSNLEGDIEKSAVMELPEAIRKTEDDAHNRLYGVPKVQAVAFELFHLPNNALMVLTPLKNGAPFFSISVENKKDSLEYRRELMGIEGEQIDWLVHYRNDGRIDISALINDDFYEAIRLTYRSGLYLSSMKLLMSCIDSLAYVEYGTRDAFTRWLKEFADLTEIGITPAELWELRNGVLHMSNLNASKVEQGKVNRVSFCVGRADAPFFHIREGIHYFDFKKLIEIHSNAISRWIDTYNIYPEKFELFVERYDVMISDSRLFYHPK